MGKHYKGTVGTDLIVNAGCDISTASSQELWITKPSGTKVIWPAEIYNSRFLKHTIVAGDWDESGTFKLQSHIVIDGWDGPGDETTFDIYDTIKD
jgi:hypothetical protein